MIPALKRALLLSLLATSLSFCEPPSGEGGIPESPAASTLPSAEEVTFKTLLLPAWGAYASGNNRLATVFALVEAGILRGGYELLQLEGDQPEAVFVLGLALLAHRAVAGIANQSQVNGNERMGRIPTQAPPGTHRFGISVSAGQYIGASGYGLSLDLGKVRLSARRGAQMPTLDYRVQDDLGGMRMHRLTFAGSYALGVEGIWRINDLLRVQPGLQVLAGSAIRETFYRPDGEWGDFRLQGRDRNTWTQAVPTLTLAFDAFDPLAVSTGIGYEWFRPGPDESFYRAMSGAGALDEDADEDEEPDRLRFHIECEYRFL